MNIQIASKCILMMICVFSLGCSKVTSSESEASASNVSEQEDEMFGFKKKAPTTLEEKIEALAAVGVVVDPERTIEEMLESNDREAYEEKGFESLLFTLALEVETGLGAGAYYTNQLYWFDTECIEDTGDYARVAMRFAEMFRDEFEIKDISDKVDWDNESAELSFECGGKRYHKSFVLDSDWLDVAVFELFIQASADMDSLSKIGFTDSDGQDIRLCVMTLKQMKAFNKLTGQNMRVMTVGDL